MKHLFVVYLGALIALPLLLFVLSSNNSWFVKKDIAVASPLPSFLTATENNEVTTLDLWLPKLSLEESNVSQPDIQAKAALSYDLTTNKTLYSHNSKEKLPMASLTKIMTAIVALESQRKDDSYSVYKSDLVGEDSMELTKGEKLSLLELLYGLILNSGNDAAETIASNYPKGREAFINAMNDKAKSLGLTDTHFTNPTGLEGDGNQYTTPYDLLVITRYALSNFALFREVAGAFDYTIDATSTHKAFYLENETNLISSYPGVKGVKTGYTPEANLCLVTYLEYKGHSIIAVLLGSGNRRQEMKDLLDYSLKMQGITPPPHG